MKRTMPILGLAIALVGILQPITNVPKAPKVSAENNTKQIVKQVEAPKSTVQVETPPETPVEAPETAPEPEVVETTIPDPEPVYAAPTLPSNDSKSFIYSHESGNNPSAINGGSGACGLGQALPCSKMPCSLDDYGCQDQYFTNYMLSRYGSWGAAESFWRANSWW